MRLFGVVGFVFGLLLISLGVLYGPRQEMSGAYWLLENGYISASSQPALYRTLPDGSGRRPVLVDEVPHQNMLWLTNTNFYYVTHTQAGFTVRRRKYIGGTWRTIIEPRPADITTTEPSPLSPDGKSMVFVFYGGGAANAIIRTNTDGADPTEIYEGNLYGYEGLIWSPDSQWIYFAATGNNGRGNFRLSVDGARFEAVSSFGVFGYPVWMLGGEILVFTGGAGFYAMDAEGGEPELLFTIPASAEGSVNRIASAMAISEEEMVVIAGSLQHQVDSLPWWDAVFRVNVATGEIVQLTPFGSLMASSLLTNDKEWLVYAGEVDGVQGVYQMRLDGSGRERSYEFSEAVRFVHFENTPDERWVIVSYLGQGSSLVLKRVRISLNGGQIERMPDGARVFASPLVDLRWNFGGLIGIGAVLIVGAMGLPSAIGYVRRRNK